ncbi:MAG TPA: M20 family peptidase [Smithellaceae bacterium]|nr:M20 family peptidase [Smithellaceae bacterium]
MLKVFLKVLSGVLIIIIVVMLVKTFSFTSRQINPEPASDFKIDSEKAARNLADAVRIPTISFAKKGRNNGDEFLRFHKYLEQTYPRLHKNLKKEIINKYSLLYTWRGSDKAKKPIVLMAHMDVVPVEEKSKDQWKYGPFAGSVAEGYIWGRGTLDNKGNLMGILEAVEGLLKKGFRPQQTIYIVSGHDEEIGGMHGALTIVTLLKARAVRPDFVLDEGMVITDGIMPGISSRVGLIGLAEKGYLSVELLAVSEGGHSSLPPRETAVGILCRAITRLENNPLPARLDGPAKFMFDYIGREMSFVNRVVFANLWITEGILKSQLQKIKTTNAIIRTTTAPTMLEGSSRDNVLPNVARAVVNFRILPGDTPQIVLEHIKQTLDDRRIEIKPLGNKIQGASPVAAVESKNYRVIEKAIRQVFPNVIVAPSLAIVASDARHFAALTPDVYRFAPMSLKFDDLARLHGINERLAVDNYVLMIKFYMQLISNSQQ